MEKQLTISTKRAYLIQLLIINTDKLKRIVGKKRKEKASNEIDTENPHFRPPRPKLPPPYKVNKENPSIKDFFSVSK